MLRHIGRKLVAVQVLEDFVEAVFACTLERVANEGGRPTEEDTTETFFCVDCSPGLCVGLVYGRIDLATAFYLVDNVLANGRPEHLFALFEEFLGSFK